MTIRLCAICPATADEALAADWTTRTLDEPVAYRSAFTSARDPLPPVPAGKHDLCGDCSEWLADHRDRALPPGVVAGIDALTRNQDPFTARYARRELVGMIRHLAEAFTSASPLSRPWSQDLRPPRHPGTTEPAA